MLIGKFLTGGGVINTFAKNGLAEGKRRENLLKLSNKTFCVIRRYKEL